jgi:hypothetical protein
MNLLNGKIVRKAGGLAFESKTANFFLPSSLGKSFWKSGAAINDDVILGVDINDTGLPGGEPGQVQLRGEVVDINPRGANTIVTARVGDENIRLLAGSNCLLRLRQVITIAFNPSRALIMRALTGPAVSGG